LEDNHDIICSDNFSDENLEFKIDPESQKFFQIEPKLEND